MTTTSGVSNGTQTRFNPVNGKPETTTAETEQPKKRGAVLTSATATSVFGEMKHGTSEKVAAGQTGIIDNEEDGDEKTDIKASTAVEDADLKKQGYNSRTEGVDYGDKAAREELSAEDKDGKTGWDKLAEQDKFSDDDKSKIRTALGDVVAQPGADGKTEYYKPPTQAEYDEFYSKPENQGKLLPYTKIDMNNAEGKTLQKLLNPFAGSGTTPAATGSGSSAGSSAPVETGSAAGETPSETESEQTGVAHEPAAGSKPDKYNHESTTTDRHGNKISSEYVDNGDGTHTIYAKNEDGTYKELKTVDENGDDVAKEMLKNKTSGDIAGLDEAESEEVAGQLPEGTWGKMDARDGKINIYDDNGKFLSSVDSTAQKGLNALKGDDGNFSITADNVEAAKAFLTGEARNLSAKDLRALTEALDAYTQAHVKS